MIYVGIDVHNKSWSVSIHIEQFEHKTFNQPPEPDKLVKYLRRNFPGADYHVAYEAGYNGFWVFDSLKSLGIDCHVIHPADIPITDKDKRHKSDPRDSRRIARSLKNDELNSIYVPSIIAREDRALMRQRMRLIKDKTRTKNRIKSLLRFHGVNLPPEYQGRCWSKAFISWLSSSSLMHSGAGVNSLLSLIDQFKFYSQQELSINRQIRELAKSDRY